MNEKVLIIEDNKEIRENTAELLELSHYQAIVAENGSEGFDMAKDYRPDVIICDIMMPDTDGRQFLKLARHDKFVRQIPLIFFSAGSPNGELDKFFIKESDEFLMKPFSRDELLKTVEKVLHKRQD